ncbi:MAG TPA: helix-turn-helix transcriptional regulator [Burkholderiales bacterium]|nr:helix-turn-helix transcriptional regulator [Burkholderiales bacterium]
MKTDVTDNRFSVLEPAILDSLSPRQRQVLTGIARGLSVKEIAAEMGLSVKTIETHRAALLAKTGLRNIVGLVLFAVYHRLVDIEHLLCNSLRAPARRARAPAGGKNLAS